jgi:hypothetical protein
MMKRSRNLIAFLITIAVMFLVSCGDAARQQQNGSSIQFTAPTQYPSFSGARAFELLERQVDFGPRVPGSPAHATCLAFYEQFFRSLNIAVERQDFSMPGYDGSTLSLHNLIARIHPEAKRRVLFAAHWDSRPWADYDPNPDHALQPIPGANDGASGVAVLLHLAELLAKTPPPIGVDIVLFDGEDYGHESDQAMFLLGSRYFSVTLDESARPDFAILLDLVGDRDAVFPQEEFSRTYAGDILDFVWQAAADLGFTRFTRKPHSPILDDHVPLNTVAGIKTINIIDAALVGHDKSSPRRQYWHTLEDTPEQCSPGTLGEVGTLLMYIVFGLQQV